MNAMTLTDPQKEEFPTPKLQEFALAYLEFIHSSPCTAKRKKYRYFEPLPEEKLSKQEILYGKDREKTYNALMVKYELCRVMGEFSLLFGDKNLYWKSKTIPGLVIIKKWLG